MLDKQKNRGALRPYLRNVNVRWGAFDLDDVREMPFEDDELDRYSVRLGDVVVCEGGEPGRCAVWTSANPFFIQKALHRVRCGPAITPMFVSYWLRHMALSGALAKRFTGTTIQHLPGVALDGLVISYPSLPEQHSIVAAIETHFSRLDAAVASLTRAKANLKRARASVLKAAVEGRLVPTEAALARAEGRAYEPASVLLDRILVERKAAWVSRKDAKAQRGKYQEPVKPETEGLPGLPEGWCWASVDQTASAVRNGYSGKPVNDGPVHILRISAVRPGRVDRSDHRHLDGTLDDYEGAIAIPGDLLVTRYNGSPDFVGVMGLVGGEGPIVHPDKLIRVSLAASPGTAAWFEVAFNVGVSRSFVRSRIRTTAGQAGVSGSDVKLVPVPLPPLAEQHRIVAEVDRRLSVLDALDTSVDANLARCARLRQSVLKLAFEGRLVPAEADAPLLAADAPPAAYRPEAGR